MAARTHDDHRFGVRIRVAGDPGAVATMLAPLAGLDGAALEAQLSVGPVILAEGVSRAEAEELVAVCTSLGAEAHLLYGDEAQTAAGTLVGASVASLVADHLAGGGDARVVDLAGLTLSESPRPHQTAAYGSQDLRAALDAALARSAAHHDAEPTLPAHPLPPEVLRSGGFTTQVFGSVGPEDALDDGSEGPEEPPPAPPRPGRGSGPLIDLDPFTVGREDRRQTVPRLPAVDRPPPLLAPPPREDLGDHQPSPLETSGFASESGPLLFRLQPPTPQATKTGSIPRPASLTHSHPPAEIPDTLTDEPPPDENPEPFGALRAEPTGPARSARPEGTRPEATRAETTRRRAQRGPTDPVSVARPRGRDPLPLSARRSGADHRPGLAALYSLVLPGMGQVYNGQFERAGWYALGALLGLPWIASIVDAWIGARQIRGGQRQAPPARHRRRAVVSQLALNLSVLFVVLGGFFLYRMRTRPRPPPPVAVPAPPVPAQSAAAEPADPSAVTSAVTSAPALPAPPPPGGRPPIELDLPVPDLMRRGQVAFDRGLYAEAEDIMHAVIRREPGHKEAYRLLVEANGRRGPGLRLPSTP